MERGDKLTEEQKKIIEENIPLVIYIAKKYFTNDHMKNQDIIQEGIYAMIKALPNYDPKKAKFSTYMYPTIDWHLKRVSIYKDRLIPIPHQNHLKEKTMERAEAARYVLSLDLKYNNDGEEGYTLKNILPADINIEKDTTNNIVLENAIKSLQWREKIIIIYRFYLDLNQSLIGKMLGISQAHTHRLEKKALKKLKAYIE